MVNKLSFKNGIKDGIPIFFAYLAVSFTFGITATGLKISQIITILISATNLTSAGQVAGVNLISVNASLLEIFCVVLIINSRYLLMGTSISQMIEGKVSTIKRLFMSCFITDEIYAIANSNKKQFSVNYFIGLGLLPYIGWLSGTILGSFASSILPDNLIKALQIAIYCMFIAIIIPPAIKSLAVSLTILIATGISCLFYYVKVLSVIPSGIQIIIAALFASIIISLVFPIKTEEDNNKGKLEEKLNE